MAPVILKSNVCQMASRLETQEEPMWHFKSKGCLLAKFSLAQGMVSLLFYSDLHLVR